MALADTPKGGHLLYDDTPAAAPNVFDTRTCHERHSAQIDELWVALTDARLRIANLERMIQEIKMGKFVTMKAGNMHFTSIIADDGTVSISADDMMRFIDHCAQNGYEIGPDSVDSIIEMPIASVAKKRTDEQTKNNG